MKKRKAGKGKDYKNKHRNIFFMLFFFFFIGGYAFFFSSPLWMPTSGEANRLTELNKEILWNDRKITLIRWDYAPAQELMEVEIGVVNTTFDGGDAYDWTARLPSGKELEVMPVLEESDWVVLQIKNVPDKFAEISLRMEMPN